MLRFVFLTLCVVLCLANSASGQSSQQFIVGINPEVTILSQSTDQTQTHPGTTADVQFIDSTWFVESNVSAGASVTFACTPFVNASDNAYKRDVELHVQSISNLATANWVIDAATDATNHEFGDNDAQVAISTNVAGAANVQLYVKFITGANPNTTLAAGNYRTDVIGTITAN